MASPTVVEQLDIIEYIRSGFVADCVDPPLDPLSLEELEEAFGYRIVVAISAPAH